MPEPDVARALAAGRAERGQLSARLSRAEDTLADLAMLRAELAALRERLARIEALPSVKVHL